MNRRTFLQGACGGLVAASGCLGFGGSTPFVTNRTMTILERSCGDQQNIISLNYGESADQLRVDGILSGTRMCGDLDITYAASNPEDKIIIDVVVTDAEECGCPRYYDYEATVSFRETPDVVAVAHSAPEDLLDMQTIILDEGTTTTDPS